MKTAFPRLDFSLGTDAARLAALVPDAAGMRACIQDAVHHAEGDVWTHTVMVCESLAESPGFKGAGESSREALSWAALLHDVAKPATRTVEFDPVLGREKVSHPHHAAKGARTAWAHLWRLGADVDLRRDVHALVSAHQRVFHVLGREDWEDAIVRHSQSGSWRDLVTLALADNEGRRAPNRDETRDVLALVHMAAEELGCLDAPYAFPSEQALTRFMRTRGSSRHYAPPAPKGSRVVVLSGMPGVGKSTYAETVLGDLPQVSFDAIRKRMKARHGDREGEVAQAAFEEARVHLRAKEAFVWNATSVTRLARDRIVGLSLEYDAKVEIHVLDAPYAEVVKRNASRGEGVPKDVFERYVDRFEPVVNGEAHVVSYVDAGRRFERPIPEEQSSPSP